MVPDNTWPCPVLRFLRILRTDFDTASAKNAFVGADLRLVVAERIDFEPDSSRCTCSSFCSWIASASILRHLHTAHLHVNLLTIRAAFDPLYHIQQAGGFGLHRARLRSQRKFRCLRCAGERLADEQYQTPFKQLPIQKDPSRRSADQLSLGNIRHNGPRFFLEPLCDRMSRYKRY
jgi:hypothetical protein